MKNTKKVPIGEHAPKTHISRSKDEIVVVLEDFEELQNNILATEISLVFNHYLKLYDDRVKSGKGETI